MAGPVYSVSLELVADKLVEGSKRGEESLRKLGKAGGDTREILKTLAEATGIAAAGMAIVKFYDESIKAAAKYEEAWTLLDVTISNTGARAGFSTKQLAEIAE